MMSNGFASEFSADDDPHSVRELVRYHYLREAVKIVVTHSFMEAIVGSAIPTNKRQQFFTANLAHALRRFGIREG